MADQSNTDKEVTRPQKSFRRRVQSYFFRLAMFALLMMFAFPWLASIVISQQAGEVWLSEQLPGNIQIGEASIGWSSPILLNDVAFADEAGQQLFEVKAVTSNQSLWDFFRRPERPMELEFEQLSAEFTVPRSHPEKASVGSSVDIQSVVKQLLTHKLPVFNRQMQVSLIRSQLELKDEAGATLTRWEPISGKFTSTGGVAPQQTLHLEAPVAEDATTRAMNAQASGSINLDAQWAASRSQSRAETLQVDVGLNSQPLTALEPALGPYAPSLFPIAPASLQLTAAAQRIPEEMFNVSLKTHSAQNELLSVGQSPISFDVAAEYSRNRDRIDISRVFAQVDEAEIDVEGSVQDVSGEQVVDMQGKLNAPAEGLLQILPKELKENVQFTGVNFTDVAIKGPLRPDANKPFNLTFELSTNVTWQEATAYGLVSKNGEVKMAMAGSKLKLTPVDIPISEGRIRQLPSFDFGGQQTIVNIEQGVMLDGIQLSEEVCEDWLRYVSPILADATTPSGTFSLVTQPASFELEQIDKANLSGQLLIHAARVRPGPMANDVVNAVNAVRVLRGRDPRNPNQITTLALPKQTVDYQLVDGRVYHAGLQFLVGNIPFTSNGSVGLDETLDLVVSISLPDSIAERGPILSALQGESIDFTVRGTFDKPIVKAAAIKDTGARIGIKAAEGLLQKLIERRQEKRRRSGGR